jgi:ribokinase
MIYDILSLGPARMDVFVKLADDQVEEMCNIDRKESLIALPFGEKVPVKEIHFAVGGNTGNNAVGVTRLGLSAVMAGAMGDGWSDKQALDILKSEKVDVQYMTIEPGKAGFGVVINYAEERTILSYYPDTICQFPRDSELSAAWLYITTAGDNFEDFYHQAVDFAKAHGSKIAFNPGSRQIKAGFEKIKFVIESAEVIFVNKEEAEHLLGKPMDAQIKELLTGLHEVGVKTVVITDGMEGSYLYDGNKFWHMPVVPANVVERTGAGDAFGSGFLAAIMKGKTVEEAMRWGTCNSSSVLEFIGPQAGLLTQTGMDEWLAKTGEVVPGEF